MNAPCTGFGWAGGTVPADRLSGRVIRYGAVIFLIRHLSPRRRQRDTGEAFREWVYLLRRCAFMMTRQSTAQ